MKITAGLAPMAGFSDIPFRLLCHSLGADYAVTEMISAAAVCFNNEKTLTLSEISSREGPCALQLFGHDAETVSNAIHILLGRTCEEESVRPAAVEINMGCPVKKIVSSGDGSALMKSPELAGRIVKFARDATSVYKIPLWVKIRAGWDKNSINAPYFAALMADQGAERITVHGRTRELMYAPSSDNAVIQAVRKAVPDSIEVFGNGDICSAADAVKMIDQTECDGVLVGRAALGDPWIFSELKAFGDGREYAYPSVDERVDAAVELTRAIVDRNGENYGIRMARGRAAHFIKGIRGSANVRDMLNHASSFDEFESILRRLAR